MTSQKRPGAEIGQDEFRRIGHALIDRVADLLAEIPRGPVKPDESAAAVRAALHADRPLPETGADPAALVSHAADLLASHSLFNGHPRFFGYITSSPAPIGILGDLLAAAINPNVGGWALAPMATEIEAQAVRWIAEFIGFPIDCGGVLVSGGNMANLVGFAAGRAAKAGWDVRRQGIAAGPPLCVYGSAETHTWIHKAADLFGLGTDNIRWIPVDERQRMKVDELRTQIAADVQRGHRPIMVIGTAGSVSTGAVDPLGEIAAVCREHDLWFHVDGAYGGLAAPVPSAPEDLRALSEADSVAVDPHKWFYAPLEAGCALVRNRDLLRGAFSYRPPYYRFDEQVINFVDYSPQNSRGFRALKVWLGLQHLGRSGYMASIGEDIRLSQKLFDLVHRHGEFEALSQGLSIATFRYVPPALRPRLGEPAVEERLNTLNQALLARIEQSGAAFFSNAVVNGKFALRACIVNFHTTDADIEAIPDLVANLGRQIRP